MSDSKREKRAAMDYFLPTRAIRASASAVGSIRETAKDFSRSMAEQMPSRDANGHYEEGDLRGIADDGERFEAIYEANRWTAADLSVQRKACNRTRMVALCLSIICSVASLLMLFIAPLWVLIFALPLGGIFVILGLAQAFKYALYCAQIDMRSLFSARQFYAMPDMWQRMFKLDLG